MNNNYHAPIQFKHYKSKRRYGKRKIKINLTVVGIIIFAVACVVGTVCLGNYLRGKVDAGDGVGYSGSIGSGSGNDAVGPNVGDAAQTHESMRSGCFDLATGSADRLFDAGYDAVTVPLTDEDGVLLYDSDAAKALSRQPAETELPKLGEKLSEIRAAASARGIKAKITVYYDMKYSQNADPVISEATLLYETAVIAEAYSLGADEALITGIPVEKDAASALEIIDKLRASAPGIRLRLALPYEIFGNAAMSQTLDAVADAAGALAVDTRSLDWSYSETSSSPGTDPGAETGTPATPERSERHSNIFDELDRAASSIRSSVSLYSLGFVLLGDNMYLESEAVDALIKNGIYSYYTVTSPEDTSAPSTGDTEPPATDDTGAATDPDPKPKPKPKPETDQKPETDPAPDTDPAPGTDPTPGTDPVPDTDPTPGTDPSPDTDPAPDTDPGTETEPDTDPDTETTPGTETEPGPEPEPGPGDETESPAPGE